MIIFFLLLTCGVVAAMIAHHKGRNPVGWFFFGFFFGFVAVIVSLVVSNVTEDRVFRAYTIHENQHLRAQLYQEKIKTETFRGHATQRLDIHDNRLGVDTRHPLPLSSGVKQIMAMPAPPRALPAHTTGWYCVLGNATIGPTALSDLQKMAREKFVTPQTLVWADHLPEWTAAQHVPELAVELRI